MAAFITRRRHTPPRPIYVPPPPPPPSPSSSSSDARTRALLELLAKGGSDKAALAALSAAAVAANVGLTTGELGTFVTFGTNPYTAIPAAALLIAELAGLIPSFSGKPKLLDSAQAAQRLLSTPFVPLQQLGERIAILVKNGVPLSSSDPAYQEQIRQAVGGTVQTILSQYPLAGTPAAVDVLVRRALTSQSGDSATRQLEALLARSALLSTPAKPPPPMAAPLPPRIAYDSGNQVPAKSGGGDIPLEALQWLTRSGLIGGLGTLGFEDSRQLGHCVLDFIRGHELRAIECITDLGVRQIGQAARDFLRAVRALFTRQGGTQPQPPPPVPTRQPSGEPVPLVPHQPCESCMTPKQRALYRQEQDQLKKEIQIERQQNTDQQLEQIGQELEQLQELEQQPLSQRDVSKELQRKAELQAQLDQLGNQAAEQPSSPAPFVPANIEQIPIKQKQPSQEPITFCVGCQSNEDAILFLNGEPSACSVIPGSTKPLIPAAAADTHTHTEGE